MSTKRKVQIVANATTPKRQSCKAMVINSLDDLQKLHEREHAAKRQQRLQQFQQIIAMSAQLGAGMNGDRKLTTNWGNSNDLIRAEFLRFMMDGPREIDSECGYPAWLTPDHYRLMYDREGIARRVVNCEPEESWAMDPEINENEDSEETAFEKAVDDLNSKHNIWHYLQRLDVLSGIGQYGVLLLGINDGKNLNEPIDGFNDDGTVSKTNKYQLLFMRPFSEDVVFVKTRETDTSNRRYGLPTMYTVHFRDFPNWGVQAGEIVARDVHWTRMLHAADNRKMSEIFGTPRMQPVWNRLYDLRKIYAASGESFWKGCFSGISFEVNPELADQGVEIDKDSVRKEMDKFTQGLQRYIATTGVSAKTLPTQVTDPTGAVEAHLKAIAISLGIPYRILFGSEEAKLAGNQDSDAWIKRVMKRQGKYLTPMLVRPFIERMIALGVLPEPKEFQVVWPDLHADDDQSTAQVGMTRTQALAAYVQGGVAQLVPPPEYLKHILDMTDDEIKAILKAAGAFNDAASEDEGALDQEDEEGGEGELNQSNPDAGNALEQKELSGEGIKKQVPAQLVYMPTMNRGKKKKRKVRDNKCTRRIR